MPIETDQSSGDVFPAPPPPTYYDSFAPPPAAPDASMRSGPTMLRRTGIALLLGGLLAGGGVAYGAAHLTGSSSTVHIAIDDTPLKAPTTNAEAVAKQLVPAVGTIIALGSGSTASLGSGFAISNDGGLSYLVTNNHVVAGSTDLHVVMPDGSEFKAALVGTDVLDDIAVVSVPSGKLPTATFGDSAALQVGETVIAIGSPLGNQSSVTAGVISALHRTITASGEAGASTETLEDVLQTDASINPGNSGGPLADVAGRVVGVNVALAGNSTNIGYSIPSNLAQMVAADLIAHRQVDHPFMGIAYLDAIDAVENKTGFNGPGVFVKCVSPDTPAAQAGFRSGDILVAIDGVAIDNGETLGGLLQTKSDGQTVRCTVRRLGSTFTIDVKLVERPANPQNC